MQCNLTGAFSKHLTSDVAPVLLQKANCHFLVILRHLLHDRCVFVAKCHGFRTSTVHTCGSFLESSIPGLTDPASPNSSGSQNTLGTFGTRPRVSGGRCGWHAPLTSSSRAGRFSRVRGWFGGLRRLACCLKLRTGKWNLVSPRVHVALTFTVMTQNFYF